MKKALLILLLLLSVCSISFARDWAIGAMGTFGINGSTGGALLSLQTPYVPLLWGIGFGASSDYLRITLLADHWFYYTNLGGTLLNLYVGVGGYASINSTANNTSFALGGRIPVGLNIYPIDVLELFLELAPSIGLGLNPINFPEWDITGAFGFRFWIR